MTWFKVDDTLAFHAKVIAAGNPAMGLWVRAGSWSAQQLTDGHIPTHMVASLGNTAQAKRLVAVGLWEQEDDGYRFHQWSEGDRQPTREAVETKRAEWREKKRTQRRDKSGKYVPEESPEESPEDMFESPAVPSRPVPSRPVSMARPVVGDGDQVQIVTPVTREGSNVLDLDARRGEAN